MNHTRIVFAVTLCAASIAAALDVPDVGFYDDYDPNLPFNVEIESTEIVDDTIELFDVEREQQFEKTLFSFEAREGERVPSIMLRPVEVSEPLPVLIFLHGSGQDKEFTEKIATPFIKHGFAYVSFDQHTRKARELKDASPWADVMGYRDRYWKTVNDTRRLIDYLETRDDIDAERIYLVGASYGAITGTVAIARDKRIKAGVLVVGGGDFSTMVEAQLIRGTAKDYGLSWALDIVKPIARLIFDAADPVHYAPATEGTPVLMQNGSADRLVTPEAGKKLYEALGEPKELVWYDIDHPGLRDGDGPTIVQMLDDGLAWMLERDAPYRSDGDPAYELAQRNGAGGPIATE